MITQERLKELLHYDHDTGVFTRIYSTSKRIKVGDVAGSLDKKGYIVIGINGKIYKSHRLAWLYVYGTWPKEFIDHVNGIRNDNRIVNLREATWTENMRNRSVHINNTSGFRCVTWNKDKCKWQSYFRLNGKQKHLGLFDTAEDASDAYHQWAKLVHGEFYKEPSSYK